MKRFFRRMASSILAVAMIASVIGMQVSATTIPTGKSAMMLVDYSRDGLKFSVDANTALEFTKEVKKDNNDGSHKWPAGSNSTRRCILPEGTNLSEYSYINFWVKSDSPSKQAFKMVLMRGTNLSAGYYQSGSLTIGSEQWTLMSIPLTTETGGFTYKKNTNGPAQHDSFATINKIYFSTMNSNQSLTAPIYFDSVWVSKTKPVELQDCVIANFGVGKDSDDFEPKSEESTVISDEIVLPGSTTSMKWKGGYTSTAAKGDNRFVVTNKDWSDYTHLNMWVYSPYVADDVFQIILMKSAYRDDGTKRYQVKLNFKGWNLISIPFDSFNTNGDANMNWETIHKIYFDTKKQERELYFDRIWLSKGEQSDTSKLESQVVLSGTQTTYTPGDAIRITADVFDKKEKGAQLFVAEYDEEWNLIKVSLDVQDLTSNTAQLKATLTSSSDSAYIKVFVFGSESLSPLCRAVSATAKTAE